MKPSQGFVNSLLFAGGVTLVCAFVPALQRWTLLVGGSLLVILILRYQRTGGQ
jgi:hypothetical protein